jgi:hypothetical protein
MNSPPGHDASLQVRSGPAATSPHLFPVDSDTSKRGWAPALFPFASGIALCKIRAPGSGDTVPPVIGGSFVGTLTAPLLGHGFKLGYP